MASNLESSSDESDSPHWLLYERRSLEGLSLPVKLNKAVHFTCIDVGHNYIWCGSNRASLYVFDVTSLKHVYLIPLPPDHKEGDTVSLLATFHSEHLCAAALGCLVYISGIQTGTTKKPDVVEVLKTNATVTQMVWNSSVAKLYVGDNCGSIYVCSIITSRIIPRSSVLRKLDSCIVQLDFRDGVLLASTLTKCSVYHTDRKKFIDVGTKVRNGYYGAILLPAVSLEEGDAPTDPNCYCARPGLRLWKADLDGKVLATLNFKQALQGCEVSPVYCRGEPVTESLTIDNPDKLPSFSYLRHISHTFILSVSGGRLIILDPNTSEIIISSHIPQDIISCCAIDNCCYLLTNQGEVRCLELSSLTTCLESLLHSETISQAVQLTLNLRGHMASQPLLLGRIQELIPSDNEKWMEFNETFGQAIDDYRKGMGSSSRSSTFSSLSVHSDGCHSAPPIIYPQEMSGEYVKLHNGDGENGPHLHGASDKTDEDEGGATPKLPLAAFLRSVFPKRDSEKSLASNQSARRSSLTSLSSLDQSEEFGESHHAHGMRRRNHSVIASLDSRQKGNEDSCDDEEDIVASTTPVEVRRSSVSRTKNVTDESSPKISSVAKELSSPGDMVDHVKDHVKDGLTKISSQAKSLISVLKEKTISQPVIEKILSAKSKDGQSDGSVCQTPGELSEDSGSHHAFFIGDDEIGLEDEMPSALQSFLDLTELTYTTLTDPSQLFADEESTCQSLSRWCQKLCLLMSQYTRGSRSGGDRVLRAVTRTCPWRMNSESTSKCSYLAMLCVMHSCCDVLSDYTVDREDNSNSQYIIANNENQLTHSPEHSSNEELTTPCESEASASQLSLLASQCDSVDDSASDTSLSLLESASTVELVCQFVSTCWFLMETEQLCVYVERLPSTHSGLERQKALWTTVINCSVVINSDKMEWQHVFNSSLFTSYDMSTQLTQNSDREALWLYVYVCVRQNKMDEAVRVALSSQPQVPLMHLYYSLQLSCGADNLPLQQAQQVFSGYVLSLIQQQDLSIRCDFIKKCFNNEQLLLYWLEALESTAKAHKQDLCVCGKPVDLVKETATTGLQLNIADLVELLELSLIHVDRVRGTVLAIGGSTALFRQMVREGKREDMLKMLLLATDTSAVQQYLDGRKLTRDDCSFLLMQRAKQETTEEGEVCCLWCGQLYVKSGGILSWDSVAEFILKQVGAETCVDLLAEASLPHNSVSPQFFSRCVAEHEASLRSSRLVADAIDAVEQFLWSNELLDNNVDSLTHQLMSKEAELNRLVRDGYPITEDQHNELVGMSNRLRNCHSLRSLEDVEVHWGRKLDTQDACVQCELPLYQLGLNVLVFQCGHSYHQKCVSTSMNCTLCHSKA